MKKYLFTLLAMLSMLMVSCNNDSTVEPDIDGGEEKACDNLGFIADGGDILGMKLSCEGIFVELGKKYAENFPDSILVVEDYTHFFFRINVDGRYYYYSPEQWDISKEKREYTNERSNFIVESYWKHHGNKEGIRYGWPSLYTAFTNDEVTLTCDKTLFGKAPGENLTQYFKVPKIRFCMPVGIDNPVLKYDFNEIMPEVLSECFPKEVWIEGDYNFEFIDFPEEKYDELTFTLTMPLTIEDLQQTVLKRRNDSNCAPIRENKVFTSKCTIRFDWQ